MRLLASKSARRSLDEAKRRLTLGDTATSTHMARSALLHPGCARDKHVHATALLVIAHAGVLESRFRLSYWLSKRSRSLFSGCADPDEAAEASAVLSYSASALGKNAEALAAARDSIAFGSRVDSAMTQAYGLNYSGVASFWARDFATSRAVLETSAWFVTGQSQAEAASFQPLVNLAFCELLKVVEPDAEGAGSQDYSELAKALARVRSLEEKGPLAALNKVAAEVGFLIADFEKCFFASRLGMLEEADKAYRRCSSRLASVNRVGWLHSLVSWARLERARARGLMDIALESVNTMRQTALRGTHFQLASIASELEKQLLRT